MPGPKSRALPLAGLVLLASCSGGDDRREAEILDAELRGESVTLTIGTCDAEDNRAEVAVNEDEVVITVSTHDPVGGDDCADGLTVDLPEPLDGRLIMRNGSTSEQVMLTFLN